MNDPNGSPVPARVLGPVDATCVVLGGIIGVGIFFTPSSVARLVDSGPLMLLAWAIAGLIALCGALAFAELGGMYNASGAQYQIIRDCYGSFTGFLYVCCINTAVQTGAMGVIAIICARNLATMAGVTLGTGALISISCVLIACLAGANIVGVKWGSRIQNFTVYSKVATLIAITVLAIVAGKQPITGSVSGAVQNGPGLGPIAGVMAALVPCFFTLGGWQQALWIAGEVRDPGRTLPRAIIAGILLVLAVYLLANWSYLRLLGFEGVSASGTLAADAAGAASTDENWRQIASRGIAGAVGISAFGVLNAQLLAGPRLMFALARDGLFFKPFARLHPTLQTPVGAILLLSGIAVALLVVTSLASKDAFQTLDRLGTGVVFIDCVFFILTGVALFILRRKRPDAERAFRVPGYPVVPAVFVIGELGVFIGSYLEPSVRSAAVIGLAWIGASAGLYAIFFRKMQPAPGR